MRIVESHPQPDSLSLIRPLRTQITKNRLQSKKHATVSIYKVTRYLQKPEESQAGMPNQRDSSRWYDPPAGVSDRHRCGPRVKRETKEDHTANGKVACYLPTGDARRSRTAMYSRPGSLTVKRPSKTPGRVSTVMFHVSMTSTSQRVPGGAVIDRRDGRWKPK